MSFGVAYIAAFVTFVAVDMVWLGFMAGRLYRPTLGDIALSSVSLIPAAAFYVLYPVGLVIFAIAPALKSGGIGIAGLYGALFGLFTYATYDLTNQATLRNWTTQLSLVDMAWGTLLAALAAAIGFLAANRFS